MTTLAATNRRRRIRAEHERHTVKAPGARRFQALGQLLAETAVAARDLFEVDEARVGLLADAGGFLPAVLGKERLDMRVRDPVGFVGHTAR